MKEKLMKFWDFFKEMFSNNEAKARDAYLSTATDIFDLENKMRQLDRKRYY